jgi:hypothetical protein
MFVDRQQQQYIVAKLQKRILILIRITIRLEYFFPVGSPEFNVVEEC